MAENLTNFIPGILFGAEGNKKCCCTGCKESECGEGKCGCVAGEECTGETACMKGTCDDGETHCACCLPGYAKAYEVEDAECEYLVDECLTACAGSQIDCSNGWQACGCEELTTQCVAFEGDFSGFSPGEVYTYTISPEEATICLYASDIPLDTPSKGFVDGQERKSCCGPCIEEAICPQPGGGGTDCNMVCADLGGSTYPCVSCGANPDDPADVGICVSSFGADNECLCYSCLFKSQLCGIDPEGGYCE